MPIRPIAAAALLVLSTAISGCQTVGESAPIVGGLVEGVTPELKAQLKCGTVTIEQASLFNIGTACVGLDMFSEWTAAKSGVTRIDGSADKSLDKTLYLALKGDPAPVTVSFDPNAADAVSIDRLGTLTEPTVNDTPIVYWLDQVADTGGRNVPCRKQELESLGAVLADVVFRMLLQGLDRMKTYGPAKNYHALVTFDGSIETRPIIEVTFVPRSAGEPKCPR
jgi:hypothetical protein